MINQISVFLENRPGQLLKVTDILTENSINIRAINIAETSDYGILRLVCDQSEKALKLLTENGFMATLSQVVAVAVPDEVGGLHKLLEAVTKENVDIEYMYSIFGKTDGLAYMIFKVNEPEQLKNALDKNGFETADKTKLSIE